MKAFLFISEIFKKFPLLLITNAILLLIVSLLGAVSLFTISPVVDLFVHPDLKGVSPLTEKTVEILNFFGLPATLGVWLIVFVLFISLSSVFQLFARYTILKTKYAVLRDIMMGTFEDFFNAKWYFFSSGRQGVLLNTFNRELTVVGNAFGAMALFFAGILQTIIFMMVPFYISWKVTIISLVASILFAVPFILLGKLAYRLGILNTSTSNEMTSVIHENFNLAKLIIGFGNQEKSVKNLKKAFNAHRKVTIRSQILNISALILYRPLGVIMVVIALFSARKFGIPISEITVLLLALLQAAIAMSHLTTQKTQLENFFPSYEQIKSLKERAKELVQPSGEKKFDGFSQEILIKDLSFAYPRHENVLTDINMRIPKGKMIAVVGKSGAGKSTLIDMILGFHQPEKGEILFDGTELSKFDISSYRKRIGYVPQDSVLFNTTIKNNLLWANDNATQDEIDQAVGYSNAEEFISKLPEGYDTPVGDRGVRLSGGQVQRIALARAILRKPDLLILDEATSSLDTYSERLIQEAIERISKETTVIVIAHRLSTIVNADYVYLLKEGRVVEEGKYSELVKINGHFNRMIELQALETTK